MTYSIVARDAATGQLGVAVQTHAFAVGSIVPWARPGVGAVATQAMSRTAYGPRGLELMEGGASAADALAQALQEDDGRDVRQVAMVSGAGEAAGWTGPACIGFASDLQGDGVSCQANIMRDDGVPAAMLEAFMWESGPLHRRLFAALMAGEEAGGDLRGKQSAALLLVPGTGEWWETDLSLRIEDSPDPLGELGRLLRLHDAYQTEDLTRAAELAPESEEIRFWGALEAAQSGDDEAAVSQLRLLIAENADWRVLLERLTPAVAPSAPRLLDLLGE